MVNIKEAIQDERLQEIVNSYAYGYEEVYTKERHQNIQQYMDELYLKMKEEGIQETSRGLEYEEKGKKIRLTVLDKQPIHLDIYQKAVWYRINTYGTRYRLEVKEPIQQGIFSKVKQFVYG